VTLVWQGKLTKNRLSNRLRLRLTVVIGIPNFVDKLLLDFKSPFGRNNNFNNQIYNVFFAQNRRYGKLVVNAKMEFNNQATITFIIITKYMIWK
jgi:hypothetical protein